MFPLPRAMRRATRLTRKGKPLAATSALQKALSEALSGTTAKRPKPKRSAPSRARPSGKPAPKRATAPSGRKRQTPNAYTAPFTIPRPTTRARVKRTAPAPLVAPGAQYVWRTHSGPHGTRRYRLYVPAKLPEGPRPLLVMLHGCTQGADDFARGTRALEAAERHGVLVALPEQDRAANAMACWNWFEPAHQDAGYGEPAVLLGIVRNITAKHAVDPRRVFVAGLSAGGAMAAVLGAVAPDTFAAIGVHSGLPYRSARDVSSAMKVMRSGAGRTPAIGPRADAPRTFIVHGTADGTVSPRNADRLFAAMGRGEAETERRGRVGITRLVRGGRIVAEDWRVAGLGHAWSGGAPGASYTDPDAPDVTDAMLRFFLRE